MHATLDSNHDCRRGPAAARPTRAPGLVGAILAAAFAAAPAVPQTLLKDIDPGVSTSDAWSSPEHFVTIGSTAYFIARRSVLWKTDGTAAGTVPLKDLGWGARVHEMIAIGSTLYFAVDGPEFDGLWRSDGTGAGTVQVVHLPTVYDLTDVAGTLYFVGDDDTSGLEPWNSDGTTAGTALVEDVNPGPAGSFPRELVAIGSTLFFAATDPTRGRELWKSQGTAASTRVVLDVNPGAGDADPADLTEVGGFLYFTADDGGATGRELYRTTGISTNRVADIRPGANGSDPRELAAVGTTLYFQADDGTRGAELWKSRGTAGTTALVADLRPGAPGSRPQNLVAVGSLVYFAADDGATGFELWRSDGTALGTRLVADIGPTGPAGEVPIPLHVSGSGGGTLLFAAYDGTRRWGLYRTRAAALGALRLADVRVVDVLGRKATGDLGGVMLFSGESLRDRELWRSDGTVAGTFEMVDLLPPQPLGSSPYSFTEFRRGVYFSARDAANGRELWTTDGTPAGTVRVRDIRPGVESSLPTELLNVRELLLYFVADDGSSGRELWKTDGTAAGTAMVADIQPGFGGSEPCCLEHHLDRVFFLADDGMRGRELWRSDGTAGTTSIVKDIRPGAASAFELVSPIVRMDRVMYFFADDGVHGRELWRSDGTDAGTYMVLDIDPGAPDGIGAGELVRVGVCLYFVGQTAGTGRELWQSDGTAAGTRMVTEIVPGPGLSLPLQLTKVNRSVYFVASTPGEGRELWITDGTALGTHIVLDILSGPASSWPEDIVETAGGTAFFTAFHPATGRELYTTRGTPATTSLVRDVNPGPDGSVVNGWLNRVAPLGSSQRVIFSAARRARGVELWRSEGTSDTTELLLDIRRPNPWGSDPSDFQRVGTTIYFAADDGRTGRELHAIDLLTAGGVLAESFGYPNNATNNYRAFIARDGFPYRGNAGFAVELRNALPGAPAALLLSATRGDLAFARFCVVYPALPAIDVPTVTDGSGAARVPIPIPDDPALLGVEAFLQFAYSDPGGGCVAGAVSLSSGFHIMIND